MRPSPSRIRQAFTRGVLLVVLLPGLIACPGKKHHKDVDVQTADDLPSPSLKLSVGGVDPASGTAQRVFPVEIFGSGFQRGATVSFSNTDGAGARVTDDASITVSVPGMPAGLYDVIVKNPDGGKAILRRGLTLKDPVDASGCRNFTIYFGTDSSVVEAAMRPQLDALATCARSGGATIRVEGNCDHSGTTEYNLALGQRRAEAVARYLQGLGVPPQKLRAVSYGEERPAAAGNDDASAARNRRADILLQE